MPDRNDVTRWAEAWIQHWNSRDARAVLDRYREDVRFESPMAEAVAGSALVEGKATLQRYLTLTLTRFRTLHFELERIIWDPELKDLAIVYVAEIDGQRKRGCELVTFDDAGQVMRGESCFGATDDRSRPVRHDDSDVNDRM